MGTWQSGDLFEVPLSDILAEKALRFLSGPSCESASPHYASTVMLVRDASKGVLPGEHEDKSGGVEVFMLRRAETMAFVPNAVVFPGGRVDLRDSDARLPWFGPTPAKWAEQMVCSEELARRVVVAAAREVFEECGVLLAGTDENNIVDNLSDREWDNARESLANHDRSFAEILIEHDLIFRSDLLGLKSRWLTPEFETRRYDTFFFAALLPFGQKPDDRTSEAAIADWVTPEWVFRQANQGELLLLPPTLYNLKCIADAANAADFVSEVKAVKRIMLKPQKNDDGTVVLQCILP